MHNQAELILLAAGVVVTWTAFHQSPKEEMVLLKLKTGVKSAAAVCEQNFLPWLEFIVFMLVENFGGKSKWICPNQGHEEIFPSDEISFACSSINVCIITYF